MRRIQVFISILSLALALALPTAATGQASQNSTSAQQSMLRGFTVTLALGEIEGGRSGGSLTPAASKALAELKDFLPYKSYQVLDTVWQLGLNGPHQFLQGQDGKKHEFVMRSELTTPVDIRVAVLRLWDAKDAADSSTPVLIDTTFSLKVGETIAVGTSRIDSNRGLVLLVTAASR